MTKQKKLNIWSIVAVLVVIPAVLIGLNFTTSVKTPAVKPTATPLVTPTPTNASTSTPIQTVIDSTFPAGFEPASASFISSQTGFGLGIASCVNSPCLAIAKTQDGGRTWSSIPTPNISLVRGDNPPASADTVSGIRFVDAMDGYLYGPDLYITHDGGATWRRITLEGLPSPYAVTSIETNGRETYLFVGYPNVIPSPTYLYISKGPAEPFIQSKFIFPTGSPTQVTANSYGAVITVNWRGGTTGPTDRNGNLFYQAPGTSTSQLILGCGGGAAAGSQNKTVLTASDLKMFIKTKTDPPFSGDLEAIASPNGKTIAIGASSGATFTYLSSDGGATWKTAFSDTTSGGSLVHDLVFISASKGIAVEGYATTAGTKTSAFLMTNDRGRIWQEITF